MCRFQLWGVYHTKCPRWGPGDESLFSGDESRLLLGQEDLRGEGPLLAGPAQVPAQPLHHAVDAQEPEAVAAPLGGGKAAAGLCQLPAGGEVGKGDVQLAALHVHVQADQPLAFGQLDAGLDGVVEEVAQDDTLDRVLDGQLYGMRASARTGTPLDRAREILLFRMASAMVLPVFTAGSTLLRSCSSSAR